MTVPSDNVMPRAAARGCAFNKITNQSVHATIETNDLGRGTMGTSGNANMLRELKPGATTGPLTIRVEEVLPFHLVTKLDDSAVGPDWARTALGN